MPPKTRGQSQKEVEKNKDSDLAQGTPRKKAPPSKSGVSTRTYVSALETNSDPSEGQSTGDITQLDSLGEPVFDPETPQEQTEESTPSLEDLATDERHAVTAVTAASTASGLRPGGTTRLQDFNNPSNEQYQEQEIFRFPPTPPSPSAEEYFSETSNIVPAKLIASTAKKANPVVTAASLAAPIVLTLPPVPTSHIQAQAAIA